MPLDLTAIRARHEPYADTRVGADIAALLSEVDAQRQEIARLRAELDAARPGVEWRPDAHGWEVGTRGSFRLVLQTGSPHAGWRLFLGDARIEDGPETGDDGKAACYAAYLRACGLPPATAKKDSSAP